MRATTRLGHALARAADNHDLMTTRHLHDVGLTAREIRALVSDRLLERVIRGLYRAPGSWTPLQDIAAAASRHREGTTEAVRDSPERRRGVMQTGNFGP